MIISKNITDCLTCSVQAWDCTKREFSVTAEQSKELVTQAMTKYKSVIDMSGPNLEESKTKKGTEWIWNKYNVKKARSLLGPAPKAKVKKA